MRQRSRIGRTESNRSRSLVCEFETAADVIGEASRSTRITRSQPRRRIDGTLDPSRGVVPGVICEGDFSEIVEGITRVVEGIAATAIFVGSPPHVVTHGSVPSDFQELLLFALYRLVDVVDMIVRDLVELFLRPLDVVR